MEVLGQPIPNLQMAEELARLRVHHPIPTLVMGIIYEIITILYKSHDIFMVVKFNFQEKYIVIKLPQRCHEPFEHFYKTARTFHARHLYVEYRNIGEHGEPVLLFNGGGFVSDLY